VVVATVKTDVIVPLAGGVTDAGARLQVTVALTGEMPQVNPTAELKLLIDVIVITEVVEFPTVVVAEAGVALILKSGGGKTFMV
jgi:hypothetical protein